MDVASILAGVEESLSGVDVSLHKTLREVKQIRSEVAFAKAMTTELSEEAATTELSKEASTTELSINLNPLLFPKTYLFQTIF